LLAKPGRRASEDGSAAAPSGRRPSAVLWVCINAFVPASAACGLADPSGFLRMETGPAPTNMA